MNNFKIDSLSTGPLVLILAIATLIGVPLRTIQIANYIDPSTGFWLAENISVPLLYALCILVTAIAFAMAYFSAIIPLPEFSEKRDPYVGVTSALLALTFFMDALSKEGEIATLLVDYSQSGTTSSMLAYLVASGSFAFALRFIFGAFAALYFVTVSFSHFLGNDIYKKAGILALAPSLWGVFRMVCYFGNPISYKNVSQLLLEMGTLLFAMVFFLSFARIAAKVNEESAMWILWGSGISGAFFGYVSALSPTIITLIGKGDLIPTDYPIQYTDLAFALFATAVLFANMPRTIANAAEPVSTPVTEQDN